MLSASSDNGESKRSFIDVASALESQSELPNAVDSTEGRGEPPSKALKSADSELAEQVRKLQADNDNLSSKYATLFEEMKKQTQLIEANKQAEIDALKAGAHTDFQNSPMGQIMVAMMEQSRRSNELLIAMAQSRLPQPTSTPQLPDSPGDDSLLNAVRSIGPSSSESAARELEARNKLEAEIQRQIKNIHPYVLAQMKNVRNHLVRDANKLPKARSRVVNGEAAVASFEKGEYPNNVKEYSSDKNHEELDEENPACRDGDYSFQVVVKRGASYRESMEQVHLQCYKHIALLDLNAQKDTVQRLIDATTKEKFLELCNAIKIPEDKPEENVLAKLGFPPVTVDHCFDPSILARHALNEFNEGLKLIEKNQKAIAEHASNKKASESKTQDDTLAEDPTQLMDAFADQKLDSRLVDLGLAKRDNMAVEGDEESTQDNPSPTKNPEEIGSALISALRAPVPVIKERHSPEVRVAANDDKEATKKKKQTQKHRKKVDDADAKPKGGKGRGKGDKGKGKSKGKSTSGKATT